MLAHKTAVNSWLALSPQSSSGSKFVIDVQPLMRALHLKLGGIASSFLLRSATRK